MKKTCIWIVLFVASILVMNILTGSFILGTAVLLMIGLHELGHLAVAKWCGIKTGGFYFLPGLGGVSLINGYPTKRWHDFLIAYGGPVVGLLLTLVLALITLFLVPDNRLATARQITMIWAIINLFNLLPILPLDGGRILHAIGSSASSSYMPYGAIVSGIIGLMLFNMIIPGAIIWTFLLIFFGYSEIKHLTKYESINHKIDMRLSQIAVSNFLYVVLIASLLGLFFYC